MSFDLDNNDVTIHRQDGTQQSFSCSIFDDNIMVRDVTIKIQEGDEIHHINPAGVLEIYEIDKVNYNTPKSFPSDMHHIDIKYTKRGSKTSSSVSNSYKLENSNLVIGSSNTSIDSSTKIDIGDIGSTDPEVIAKIEELLTELSKNNKDEGKIGKLLNFLIGKSPDVIISVLTAILIK